MTWRHGRLSLAALELRGERHRAGAAARAAHGDQDALLLLLVEIGAIEHGPRLLREQLVQRQAAALGLTVIRGGRLAERIGRRGRRELPVILRALGHGRELTPGGPRSPCCRGRRAGSTPCCARWWAK